MKNSVLDSIITVIFLFLPLPLSSEFIVCNEIHPQNEPALSFDATDFFVVWSDGRTGLSELYGARVSQSGVVLDTNGFSIKSEIDEQTYPSVTFDGLNHLVVWQFGC